MKSLDVGGDGWAAAFRRGQEAAVLLAKATLQ
jgi:hypothetical protein